MGLENEAKNAKRAGRANGQRLTRRRVPLSCVACRIRKLKCNREKPCQNCVARGESNAASCTYAEKAEKKHSGLPTSSAGAEDMRKRLNRLESSILSMMSSDVENKGGKDSSASVNVVDEDSVNEIPDQAGGQRMSKDSRSTHWDIILNDLEAMKNAWSEENDKIEFTAGFQPVIAKAHRPGLLSGLTQPPDRSTILASLPSKDALNKLIIQFFNSYNPAIPARYMLHKETFLKQYNKHWNDPTKTRIIWVGLLFSILCLAMQSYSRNNEVPPEYQGTAPAITELYRIRTAQCLVIADITKPTEFMIETLNMYSQIEYSEQRDGDMGVYMLAGMMMRMALQQGYHRDPSLHPNISVFQGEMRRRIWSGVSQHDLLFSVQIGLPKAIRYSECDTELPRNIHEEELYEDMKELPPSRPLTEETEVSYQCMKARLMRAYGYVIEFVHVLNPEQRYEEGMKLDLMLNEIRAMIPLHLQLRTLEEMKDDPPSRIMERYILQLFYHKAICILHRKFWDVRPPDDSTGTYFYSRKNCILSSMALLDHQATMHRASLPGGCLEKMKWYHFSITNHDFLLAAMIVCLDLMSVQKVYNPVGAECWIPGLEKVNAIKRSREIWAEVIDECQDARRAVTILTSVLKKLIAKGESLISTLEPTLENSAPLSASAQNPNMDTFRYSPYFTDQFGLGIPLIGKDPTNNDTIMEDDFLDTLGSDLTVPAEFNWDGWDQLVTRQPPEPFDPSDNWSRQSYPNLETTDFPYSNYMKQLSVGQ